MKKKKKNEKNVCFKLKIILGYKYIIINYIIYYLFIKLNKNIKWNMLLLKMKTMIW